jgi:Zn-dependent alcohol dehydrogenase
MRVAEGTSVERAESGKSWHFSTTSEPLCCMGGVIARSERITASRAGRRVEALAQGAFKREKALEFGATHAVATNEEASALLTDLTRGRMAQVCVNTAGVGTGDQIAASLAMVGKRGRVVVTNLHRATETQVAMSALDLTLWEKQVRGSLFGSSNPRSDIPRMLELYRSGHLKLDELRTRTYSLDEVNAGYDDMRAGRTLRGVISFG